MDRDDVLSRIREVVRSRGLAYLTLRQFCEETERKRHEVLDQFDNWGDACRQAGISPDSGRRHLKPMPGKSREECLAEIRRIAQLVGKSTISAADFRRHAKFSMSPIQRHFNGCWRDAVKAAGLAPTQGFQQPIPLADLAKCFLTVAVEVARVPSVKQLSLRSGHTSKVFSTRFGGYERFKRKVISHLLESGTVIDCDTRTRLQAEIDRLRTEEDGQRSQAPKPHLRGRMLGFRAFAYAPSCEQDVVALFSAVAHDMGFQILANRAAFPDCEAQRRVAGRRDRFAKCLIEYEFDSRDFLRHGHPASGCDLIVCWKHDWPDCPLEVLELSSAIKKLEGWQ